MALVQHQCEFGEAKMVIISIAQQVLQKVNILLTTVYPDSRGWCFDSQIILKALYIRIYQR